MSAHWLSWGLWRGDRRLWAKQCKSADAERDSYDMTVFSDVNMSPFQKDQLDRSRREVGDISWVVSAPYNHYSQKIIFVCIEQGSRYVESRLWISWISTTCPRLWFFSQLQRDFPWDFTILAGRRPLPLYRQQQEDGPMRCHSPSVTKNVNMSRGNILVIQMSLRGEKSLFLLLNLPPIEIMLLNGRPKAGWVVCFKTKTSQTSSIHWGVYLKHCHCKRTLFSNNVCNLQCTKKGGTHENGSAQSHNNLWRQNTASPFLVIH